MFHNSIMDITYPALETQVAEDLYNIYEEVKEPFVRFDTALNVLLDKANEIAKKEGPEFFRDPLNTQDAVYRQQMSDKLAGYEDPEDLEILLEGQSTQLPSFEQMTELLKTLNSHLHVSALLVADLIQIQNIAFKRLKESLEEGNEGATYKLGNGVEDARLLKEMITEENLRNTRNAFDAASRELFGAIEVSQDRLMYLH